MADLSIGYIKPFEVSDSFHHSMMAMFEELVKAGISGRYLAQRYLSAGGLPRSRNVVVEAFMETDDEWLLWIDTDMGFHPDAALRLLEVADPAERPIVGALCFSNVDVEPDGMGGFVTFPIPTLYRWCQLNDGSTGFVSWHDYPRGQVVKCDSTGSAFVLIHRSVFVKMRDRNGENWYTQIPNESTGGLFGEDMSFCIQAAQVGVPVHVHTGVPTTHQKTIWLSESHFDMHRAAAEAQGVDSQVAAGGARPLKPNREQRRAAARARS